MGLPHRIDAHRLVVPPARSGDLLIAALPYWSGAKL
jgi:hypothetical protein